jgi:hypothetical protein
MNWKRFEGISRRLMESLLWQPAMLERPQKVSQNSYRGL